MNISHEMGFDQGFEQFSVTRYETAEAVNKTLREWHPKITSSGRYFLYIHYMDPHLPYHQRAPWYEEAPSQLQRTINAYDSEISYVDSKIKEMFELYQWDKNALVVILADHGEEFRDHGHMTHGKTLYREVVQVPFLFHTPQFTHTQRISTVVGTIDLLPTLADWLQATPHTQWRGLSLLPLLAGETTTYEQRPLLMELLRRPEHQKDGAQAVLDNSWHFIEDLKGGQPDQPLGSELYNLQQDFDEHQDWSGSQPQLAQELKEKLAVLRAANHATTRHEVELELDTTSIEQLKTLGYIN